MKNLLWPRSRFAILALVLLVPVAGVWAGGDSEDWARPAANASPDAPIVQGLCYALATSAIPRGAGSISTSLPPDCGAERYSENSKVELTADAARCFTFIQWTGDASGSANPTTVTMNRDRAVSAVFAAQPPPAPKLSSPPDGTSSCDAAPTFHWSPVSGATRYQIRIADESTASIIVQTEVEGTSITFDAGLSPGTYLWQVQAYSGCLWGDWSEKWWFTVLPPPPVPELSAPVDGSRTYETRPVFEWSATQGANSYRLQVDNDASFASPVIDKTKSGTSYRPSDPLPPGTYYWRVRGSYDCGSGAWSTAWGLTVLPSSLDYGAYLPLVIRGGQ